MNQFSITSQELTALLGSKEVDLFVMRRELQRAEEANAVLMEKVQELEAELAEVNQANQNQVGIVKGLQQELEAQLAEPAKRNGRVHA